MQKKFSGCIVNLKASRKTIFIVLFFIMCPRVWAYSEKVFSGVQEVKISERVKLRIVSSFAPDCNREYDLCLPLNHLHLVDKNRSYNLSKLIKYWNNETFVYFVKISKRGYLEDIDGDGHLEVAIYPMMAGNNPVTDAYIYSIVGDRLVHYGMGRFHFEWGPHVEGIMKGKWIEPMP